MKFEADFEHPSEPYSRTANKEHRNRREVHVLPGCLPLIRESSVVTRWVGETLDCLYTPISEDAEWYFKRLRETGLPLDSVVIRRFTERLEFANHRTSDILWHLKSNRGKLYPISDSDVAAISDEAWVFQISADKMVEKLLRYTSLGMKYFPRTFRYIENIDPYRFDKLSYQEKLELLEIAGEERDHGIQMERLRLKKAVYRYQEETKSIVNKIMEFSEVWNIRWYPISYIKSEDEASVIHPSLGDQFPANGVNHGIAELGYLEYRKSLLNQKYSNEIYTILEQFIFEESELVSVLNRWLGMSQMYMPADISEYFKSAAR